MPKLATLETRNTGGLDSKTFENPREIVLEGT